MNAFVALQYLLPQHGLSRLVHRASRTRSPAIKNALIRAFIAAYRPDMSDALLTDACAYDSFNEFFTRALRPGARPVDRDTASVVSPVDGLVSEAGTMRGGQLLQAKGREYSLESLLAARNDWVERLREGHFATIYLAPYDYHRIHAPLAGLLRAAWYVPGRLFSVNAATAAGVPRLFARNERIICAFESPAAAFAVVFVGALNVGSMSTVWHGEVTPRRQRVVGDLPLPGSAHAYHVERGEEIGRFNMGSTIIVLAERDSVNWLPLLQPGARLRMGEAIGVLQRAGST
jgi:phosphatidylserine decarboxylase